MFLFFLVYLKQIINWKRGISLSILFFTVLNAKSQQVNCITSTFYMEIPALPGERIELKKLQTHSGGNFILIGNTTPVNGEEEGLIMTINSTGSLVSQKKFRVDNQPVSIGSAEVLLSGNTIVAGIIKDGSNRIFLTSFKDDLTINWVKTFTLPSVAIKVTVDVFDDTSIALAAQISNSIFYSVLNSEGAVVWTKQTMVAELTDLVGFSSMNYTPLGLVVNCVRDGKNTVKVIELEKSTGNTLSTHTLDNATEETSGLAITEFNDRLRLLGITKTADGGYKIFRNIFYSSATTETHHRFLLPGTIDFTISGAMDNAGDAMGITIPNDGRMIFVKQFADYQTTPEHIKTYTVPVGSSMAGLTRSFDGGYLFGLNTINSGSLVLIKTDSTGILSGCGYTDVAKEFTEQIVRNNFASTSTNSAEILPLAASSASFTNTNFSNQFSCNQNFCPAAPIADTCLQTFYKTFRSHAFIDAFSTSHLMRNNVHFIQTYRYDRILGDQNQVGGGLKIFSETGEFIKGVSVLQDGIPATFYTRKMTDSTIMLISYSSPANGTSRYTFTLVTDNLNILWTKSFQTSTPSDFYSSGAFIGADVHRDAEGNYYFVGNNLGFMEATRVSIYKMDAMGNPLWLKTYEVNSGGVLLTANATSTPTSLILFVAGSPRSITVRLDKTTGQLLNSFMFQHQSSGSIYHRLVKFDNDRIYYAGDNKEKLLIGIFDTLGRPVKLREIADASNLRAGDVRDGMLYATAFSSDAPVQNVLLKADSNLNLSFYNKFTPVRWGYPAGLQASKEGNIYIAGNFFTATNTSYSSPWLSKYNSDGELGTCVFGTSAPTFKDIDPLTTALSYSPVSRSFTSPSVVMSFKPDMDGQQVDEILCSSKPQCTSLEIQGEPVACHLDEDYIIQVKKNPECTLTPKWSFDTAVVRLHRTTDTTAIFRFKIVGTTWIKAMLNAGCSSYFDSIEVKAYDAPTRLDLGQDTVLCPSNSIMLKAEKGFSVYAWQNGSSDSTYKVSNPGTYFVEVQNACGLILRDTVLVSPHPPIPFTALSDRVKCNNDTIHLKTDGGFISYSWLPNHNINTVNQSEVVVNPKVDTVYTLKAEKIPGCFIFDTVRIKVNHSLPINLGRDTSFCTGDSLLLDAGSGFLNYVWNTGINAKAITVRNKGSYTVTATDNNGCISVDTLKIISFYALPLIQLAKDSLLCFGDSKFLDAGSGYKQYSWSNGNQTQKVAVNQTGKYFVSVIDNNGCKASDTTLITRMLALPHDFLLDDTSLCTYSKISLSSKNNYKSYQWSTAANTHSINIDKAGTYWLRVTDQYGCKGVDSIIVNPKQCMEGFYIPNAFTPNKDGKNDLFRPLIFGNITKYRFTIYNRWGEKVYESLEPGKGWTGTYDGLEDKTSVFVWTCEYQLQGQPLSFEKGSVTLIR